MLVFLLLIVFVMLLASFARKVHPKVKFPLEKMQQNSEEDIAPSQARLVWSDFPPEIFRKKSFVCFDTNLEKNTEK